MKLYHYTKLRNIKQIWETKSLNFASTKLVNDPFERYKFVDLNYAIIPSGISIDSFRSRFFDILYNYKQISLCTDYDDGTSGYKSPMMWGHYAREWNVKRNMYEDGVCIELDSDKLYLADILNDRVSYSNNIPKVSLCETRFMEDMSFVDFIERNKKDIFFTKHKSWEHENEYRLISIQCTRLDISNAIMKIYVHSQRTQKKIEDYIPERYIYPLVLAETNGSREINGYKCGNLEEINKMDANNRQGGIPVKDFFNC